MMTPREVLRDYLTVLNILMQNPDADFTAIVSRLGEAEQPRERSPETVSEKREFSPEDIVF